jgi:hypothetical protein
MIIARPVLVAATVALLAVPSVSVFAQDTAAPAPAPATVDADDADDDDDGFDLGWLGLLGLAGLAGLRGRRHDNTVHTRTTTTR